MKFVVDVSAGLRLHELLVSAGHDVVSVADRYPRMKDIDIMEWAVEEDRIVLTLDKDFEGMVWRFGKEHRGILRLANLRRDKLIPLLEMVLDKCSKDLEKRLL